MKESIRKTSIILIKRGKTTEAKEKKKKKLWIEEINMDGSDFTRYQTRGKNNTIQCNTIQVGNRQKWETEFFFRQR